MKAPAGLARISAGEVRLWATLIVGAAYWADVARPAAGGDGTVASIVDGIVANGAFDVMAWALVLVRCATHRDDGPATPWSVLTTLLLGVIVLVPVRLAPALGLVLLGGLLFGGPRASPGIRPMRLLLFALAAETVWVGSALSPLHVLVGTIDARIGALLFGLLGQVAAPHANVLQNLSSGFSIVIWPPCASSFPLAAVALAFMAMAIYRGKPLRWSQWPWLALACGGSIVLTEIRLMLLAWNEASYRWWHDGFGVSVYALVALGWAVAVPIMATADRAGAGRSVARPA
jgi:hypothetical protein